MGACAKQRATATRGAVGRNSSDSSPGDSDPGLASQAIGERVGVRPGERIWTRAGTGGKTLQLVDALQGRGVVVASDIRPFALARMKERALPSQLRNIEFSVERPSGPFDAVLVDAPCTGSGIWRRRPDQMLAVNG